MCKIYTAEEMQINDEGFGIITNDGSGFTHTHSHEFIEFVYIFSGSATHEIDECVCELQKGDVLFIGIDQNHTFWHNIRENGYTVYSNIMMMPSYINEQFTNSSNINDLFSVFQCGNLKNQSADFVKPFVSFRGNDIFTVESIINAIQLEFNTKREEYMKIITSYMNIFFLLILREMQCGNENHMLNHMRSAMPQIIEYINHNSAEKLTLNQIAARFFYTPSYFSRSFKQYFGKSFIKYLQEQRIQNALVLMENTNLTIEEISARVGYHDRKDFYNAFRKLVGMTPGLYRKQI